MDKSDIRTLVQQMGRRPIAFNPAYAEVGGSVGAGLMIAQAIHWSAWEDEDGFFFRTMDNWTLDTALSHDEQRAARRKLKSITYGGEPLWEEKRKGLPAQIYYRINLDVLAGLLAELGQNPRNDKTLEKSNTGHGNSRGLVFDNSEHLNIYEKTNESSNENGKCDSHESQPEAVTENTLSGLEGFQSTVKERKKKKSASPPAPAKDDQRVWGMVSAYNRGRNVPGHKIAVRERHQIYNVFAELHKSISFGDIEGCTAYLASQQWYQEPGRLTADAVAKTVLDWIQKGRPQTSAPKGSGGTSGFAAAMGQFADYAKEQGQ